MRNDAVQQILSFCWNQFELGMILKTGFVEKAPLAFLCPHTSLPNHANETTKRVKSFYIFTRGFYMARLTRLNGRKAGSTKRGAAIDPLCRAHFYLIFIDPLSTQKQFSSKKIKICFHRMRDDAV